MTDIKIASLTSKTTFVDTDIMIVEDATDTKKMTMASLKSYFMNIAHPIGEVYTSVVNTNPATLFGIGTWVAFGIGKVLVGVDTTQTEFNTVEKTGGEKTNSFTLGLGYAQIAQGVGLIYSKERAVAQWFATKVTTNSSVVNSSDGPGIGVELGGSTDAGSILPPYITVYMWKRTA